MQIPFREVVPEFRLIEWNGKVYYPIYKIPPFLSQPDEFIPLCYYENKIYE
jgi:hypothetical protein